MYKKIERKINYKSLMHDMALVAGSENNIEDFLMRSFNLIGNTLDINRVYYFCYEKDKHEVSNILEWVKGDTTKEQENLQAMSCDDVVWFYNKLVTRKIIKYNDVNRISDNKIRSILIKQQIKSILVVPVYVHNEFRGFVGFDQCNRFREWNEFDEYILYTLSIMCAQCIKEKLYKEAILREHQQLLAMVDNLGGLSYAIDRESYEIIFANNELKRLYDDDLEGKVCYQVLQGKEHPCEFCTNKYITNINDTYEWEYYNEILQKEYYLIDRLIELPDGRTVRFEIGLDISDRKNLEKKLYDEKELLKVTLLSIGDGVITTDTKGNITMINKVAEEITGWSNKEAKGKPLDEVFEIINKYTRIQCENPVEKALKTEKIVGLANHTVLISKQCQERDIADSAAPIKDLEGNIIGVVLVFRDVTESIKKEEAIRYLSRRDSVTGLYNRNYFEKLIQEMNVKENLPISVIMGDVNGLKMTNDVFGHQEGDRLLKSIGRIIKESCRNGDLAARWGGDEFVVILRKTSEKQAWDVCNSIKERCSKPEENLSHFSISLGYASKQKQNEDIIAVLKQAEDHMYKNKLLESKSLRSSIIASMQKTLYERSHETEEHAVRLAYNCKKIGELIHLSSNEIDELQLLAVLHDIGKIAIKDDVLLKPGKLNDEEWDEMKRHPEIGYRIVQSVPELSHIAEYLLCHHERWDGKGYPQGLSGENIPLHSRIIAVADAYDAMTNDRPYRKALSVEKAKQELRDNAEKQFDPKVVDIFLNKVIISDEKIK